MLNKNAYGTVWIKYAGHLQRRDERQLGVYVRCSGEALQNLECQPGWHCHGVWAKVRLPVHLQAPLAGVRAALRSLEGTEALPVPLPHIQAEVKTLQAILQTPSRPAAKAKVLPAVSQAPEQPVPPTREPLSWLSPCPEESYQLPAAPLPFQLVAPATPEAPSLPPVKNQWLFLVNLYGDLSWGGTVAWRRGNWGVYGSARSHFQHINAAYSCLSDGSIPGGGAVWTQGKPQTTATSFTAGALFSPRLSWLAFYAGAGYGTDNLYWQDLAGDWVQVQDLSFKGLALEGGLLADIPLGDRLGLVLKAGILTTALKTATPTFGAGVRF